MQQRVDFLGLGLVLALGACAMPDIESFKIPDLSIARPASTAVLRDTTLRPVTAEDLVDNDGRCAAAFVSAGVSADQPPPQPTNAPLIAGGIGLDMTECEVVKRIGVPERVQIGTNERSERTAMLTYTRGSRPGIYHFTSGRLTSLERAPEPPPAPKPAKKPPSKPKGTSS